MSECICGNCPSTFKFSDDEKEEYLCLITEEKLYLEQSVCAEQLDKMYLVYILNKELTGEEQEFMKLNVKYWDGRKKIIENEINRRKEE